MPVVGLTGGIASGKSTVARVFMSRGAAVLDADEVAREVTAPHTPAYGRILERFGAEMILPDGSLDRARLAERVFADAEARKALEEITHPEIFRKLEEKIRKQPSGQIVVIEAALLLQTLDSWKRVLEPDAVVAVVSRPDDQLARLKSMRGLSESSARARIQAQGPWEDKLAAADYVLDNSGSIEDLERQAAVVWEELRARLGA